MPSGLRGLKQLVAAGRAGSLVFAPKRITGGALSVGFMKALGVEQIRSLEIGTADAILTEPDYWR
jgi:hypothetical protein